VESTLRKGCLLAAFDPEDLRGSMFTADAMHTQSDTAQAILDADADYVFTVKGNQPRLHAALKRLPWREVPVGAPTTQRGHRRRATCSIKVIEAPRLPGWPEFTGATHVAQPRRTVTRSGTKSVGIA
jgi:hypothetical protein